MKNTVRGSNSRVGDADLEDKEAENTQSERQKNQSESSIMSLRDNFKHANTCIMGVLEGEEKEQETENLFGKTMVEDFKGLA